jgi:YYY domain-containing protein
MGTAMLWSLREWGMAKWRSRPLAYLFRLVPYAVLFVSFLYALAFTRVYAQTHPWIQASRWIYDRVPDGAVIAVEHWDDHLPLSLPEERANPGEHGYRHVELPMYEPDGLEKYDLIRSRLREADYIVLSSNRLHRTIPRLPERYPVSSEFYRLLFAGGTDQVSPLGYIRDAEFTAYPGSLGGLSKIGRGLQIVDDDADESFTVYDHPKPIVFRKVYDLDDGQWNALFGGALAKTPVLPGQADARAQVGPNLLSFLAAGPLADDPPAEKEATRDLLLDRPVGELPIVDDFGWNRWASESTAGAVLTWWLLVSALGWLAWPLTFVLFGGLRDRGYLLSRMVAVLVIGYLVWLPSSLQMLKNGLPLTYAAMGVLAVVSALLLWRFQAEMRAWLRAHWRLVLLCEAILSISFLAFVGIRILNPDLWQPWNGGEKLMDIAYLNSSMRSAYWPPPDPYYAHGYLNYYYYGQFLLSILIRLTGIRTSVAFNLAVPLLFAWTVSAAFSIGYTLAAGTILPRRGPIDNSGSDHPGDSDRSGRRRTHDTPRARFRHGIAHGLLVVLCVTIVGNLASATQIVERLGWVASPTPWFGREFSSHIPGLEPVVKAASGAGEILLKGASFPGFNYWDPSRVVGFTINEFPYWSFLFADLHPHMINLPFTLLVLALALNWLRRQPSLENRSSRGGMTAPLQSLPVPDSEVTLALSSARYLWRRVDWGMVLNVVLWPLALGALAPINSWDWPAYAGFCGLALVYGHVRARGRRGIVLGILAAVALAGVSLFLYAPFFSYYTPVFVGLGWSLGRTHTDLGEFLTVWGFFLFVSITFLLILLARQRSRDPAPGAGVLRWLGLVLRYPFRLNRVEELYALLARKSPTASSRQDVQIRHARLSRFGVWGLLLLLAVASLWAWKGYWVLVLMIPLLALVAVLIVQRKMSVERRFVLALTFTAYLILVGVEFFYLKDHLDGDQQGWWRMNTLFKFYLQVWSMLGIAVGVSLPGIWRATERWRVGWRGVWTAVFALLLVSVLLYPLLGTPVRVADRFPGQRPPIGTLDGMAFMTVGTYTWPDDSNLIALWGDYQAIRWLQDNVPGTPVLAEAPIGYYREFGVRASSFTGLPTLLGMHESEQRYGAQVGLRSAQARDLFNTADEERTLELIRELGVEYVYVGPLERTEYPLASPKFEQLAAQGYLQVVYQNDLVTIYQVVSGRVP